MEQKEIEVVGKVFVVVGGKRKCLICDGMFTTKQALEHTAIPCYPPTNKIATFGLPNTPPNSANTAHEG